MADPVAHSAQGGVPAQTYADHVEKVRSKAVCNARSAAKFYTADRKAFAEEVEAAAIYHDLGKLDESNQDVLCRKRHGRLKIKHEDAGTAALLNAGRPESAVLVAAHHAGLFSQGEETGKQAKVFRNVAVANHVDEHLHSYLASHVAAGCTNIDSIDGRHLDACGFTRRVALSCLVDADHSDTARHYGNEVPYDPPDPKWQERLLALDSYVASLPEGESKKERQRNRLRRKVYDACRSAVLEPAMRSCDAPVGFGKTTAVMSHLLRVAQERRLRHILVVLPYTNIIKQSVEVYRKALVLPGEKPEDVVAEHHHQADFEDISLRQLATLWRAPIIVTTAVQFFETLANHHPARLRKLHEIPGSAVFVDETHAAIPSHLWPQVWRWLEAWTGKWGGHIVLASGSLPRFWELGEFVNPPKGPDDVPDLVPDSLRRDLEASERRRITPRRMIDPFDCEGLIKWVTEAEGPRLLILNTVQSAAVVADRMRKCGHDVLHLSTALAPIHRHRIVERIRERLKHSHEDWTLVATSCVEAGMDFSFRNGFRESCSTASLIQVGGRVSRGAEHTDAELWDFRLLDPVLAQHPGFAVPRRVLDKMFEGKVTETQSPSELAREAMRLEITATTENRAQDIIEAENGMEYPQVSELCRVIATDTRTVVIDGKVIEALRRRERVDRQHLLLHSVQIWTNKMPKLPVAPVFPNRHVRNDSNVLYEWKGRYDPDFLGYMAGVMPLLEGLRDGCFLA